MEKNSLGRRVFLKRMTALSATGIPIVAGLAPRSAHAAYDPKAKFELKVSEVEFRRNATGRMLMARVYQPQGAGPFPTLLDLHGGAWNNKDRRAEEPMDRAIAASGVLVVAIDMTLAPEAPYPACVQDANYGVRWLKSKAAGGTAIPRGSACTAARAAATWPSCSPCARSMRATTRFPCCPRRTMRRSRTSRRARRSATPSRASRTPSKKSATT